MHLKHIIRSIPRIAAPFAMALLLALLSGSFVHAAVTVNSTSNTNFGDYSGITFSHTVNAGADRVLYVVCSLMTPGNPVTGVTYGGTALSLVGRATGANEVEIWHLINPPVGTANVVVSFALNSGTVGAVTYNGVHQTTPNGTFLSSSGTGTTASVTVPSATNNLVMDVQCWNSLSGITIDGPGQTAFWSGGGGGAFGGSTYEAGAASVDMTGSCSTSVAWVTAAISINAQTYTVSGTVFEDVNYGGGAGRNWATASAAGGSARPSARVELFDAGTGAFVTSTTTDASGLYSFASVTAGSYAVRVVTSPTGSRVSSSRTGYTTSALPVMTYRTNASTGTAVDVTDYVGGQEPATVDAGNASAGWILNTTTGVFSGSGSGTAHAFAPVTLTAADVTNVNFGFNFDTVVNTNDAGQGSLRMFFGNANMLGGDASLAQSGLTAGMENAVFMISNGTAAAGLRAANNYFSGGGATINLASGLPFLFTTVTLDARLQPGYSGTPVLYLNGASAGAVNGIVIGGNGSLVRGFGIHGFNTVGREAIWIHGRSNVVIQANSIGLNASGATSPNDTGIYVQDGHDNQIGGTAAADANIITGSSTGPGIYIDGAVSVNNAILRNSLYANADQGIVLDGVGANNGAMDSAPNNGMDYPVFTSALLTGTTLTVTGYVGSAPNQATFANSRVEIFESDNDASGYGEGRTYLGFLTSDANGNFSGTLDVTGLGLNVGDTLTGTATNGTNNTSEFGANFTVASGYVIVKQAWVVNGAAPLGSPVTAAAGSTIVFLVSVKNISGSAITDVRIRDLLDQTGFSYVSNSLVRTSAASPPADTATDKQIFDATAPGTGTALTDAVDGDEASAQDTGGPAGVDRITVGAVTGQANAALTINAHTTFAIRFQVRML